MRDFSQLPRDGRIDRRMAMPVQIGPDRRIRIEIFLALGVAQDRPFSRHDHDWLAFAPIPHLRERMPDKGPIQLRQRSQFQGAEVRLTERNAASNCSMSTSVCAAVTVKRNRAWPCATVG